MSYILDQNDIVYNIFFQDRFPGSSYTIIDVNGNYISFFGEYAYDQIFEDLEELKEIE